jgi:hypothetical protein
MAAEKFGLGALITSDDVLAAVGGQGESVWNQLRALMNIALNTIETRGIREFAVPQDGVEGHALRVTVEWAGYPTKSATSELRF